MKAWFCRPCQVCSRVTVRFSDERPTMPCKHAGDGPGDCKRIEWSPRTWGCTRCAAIGRTTIVASDTYPQGGCPEFPRTHRSFVLTPESAFALRDVPVPEEACA